MRGVARAELDRVDNLRVGQGMLEAFAFTRGDQAAGMFGAGLEYGHRVSPAWSLFGRAEAGYRYGEQRGFGFDGLVGARWQQQ